MIDVLTDAAENDDDFPTPEEVVARIKALPPNPAMIELATGSLADWLLNRPDDPSFDLAEWQQDWDKVEAEMAAIELADALADERL